MAEARRPTVAVIGGGLSGLAAALALAGRADVHLFEADARLGGKLATASVRGRPVDLGPDAFVTRQPALEALCRRLGLGDSLHAPATSGAAVLARGRLRPLPAGLALGVPTDLVAVARSGIVSPAGCARALADLVLPGRLVPPDPVATARAGGPDPTIAEVVGARLGGEVLASLVDPLVGGINAGDARDLSLAATAPHLAEAAAGRRSLLRALRALTAHPAAHGAPAFLGLAGGMAELVGRLEEELAAAGVAATTGAEVEALRRARDGRRLEVDGGLVVDGAVVALPAFAAARLLASLDERLAEDLAQVAYAGVATVTLVYDERAIPPRLSRARLDGRGAVLPGSGVLVPRSSGRLVTAVTFTSTKWPRSANPGEVVLRCSAGRAGDTRALELDDGRLAAAVRAELALLLGLEAAPLEVLVKRFPAAFPQYRSGHLALVARLRRRCEALGGLALCGAAYDGIGMPACVASGEAAADRVLAAVTG
ncbi:MAG TPA: protoporphyrinogen oxidase [Acidimicrobiales bacterium]|nr:protoporphyrinogen oxidase [Acidimicrobiales bacterium]